MIERFYWFLGGVVLTLFAVLWVNWHKEPTLPGKLAPELKDKATVTQERKVVVYAKTANKPLGVDSSLDVLTAVNTKGGTAIATLNPAGEATIHLRVDPKPWVARNHTYRAELLYGLMDEDLTTRVGFTWNFLQIKALQVGVNVQSNLSQDRRGFVGLSLSADW